MLFIHFKTLFSFRFYHRLAQLSILHVVGFVIYLFLLNVIVLFFFTGSFLKTNLPVFLKNFPQVTFENGVLTQPQQAVSAPIPNTNFKIVFDATADKAPSVEELTRDNTLAWIHKNQLYIPSSTGLQIQDLPQNLNFTSDQQTLEKNKNSLFLSLRIALFLVSLVMLALFLLFDYCLTLGVLFFFNIWKGSPLARSTLLKLAAFLLGPLTILLFIHLWINVPFFTLAQLILTIIYVQQIFNTIPEKA